MTRVFQREADDAKHDPAHATTARATARRPLARVLLTEVHAAYPDADVRLGPVASITEGFRMLGRETHDPDEASPLRLSFSEWVRP